MVPNRPSYPVNALMSATSKLALVSPRLAASALASSMAVGERSSPTVVKPRSARYSETAASPQPTSSTSPWNLPCSISAASSGCGSPMLHGGLVPSPSSGASPLYAFSNRSCGDCHASGISI